MNKFFIFCFILLIHSCSGTKQLVQQNIDPYNYSSTKKTIVSNGAVVSAHPLASKVGLQILKEGGNAFDAAIATQLALAVVYPGAGNLGGGGFMVATRSNGDRLALDYREMAPASAHRDMFLDEKGNVMEGRSVLGHLSSGVPGTVAGLFETHQYARLPFKKLIEPAIALAEKGFKITAREASGLNSISGNLKQYNTMATALQKEGQWKAGDTLIQKDLAQTLVRIRDNGKDGFYEGRTAQLIEEEMKRGGGIITKEDLKSYKAKWRTAYAFDYKGNTVVSMPLPSSGGLLLHQMMKMLEKKDIQKMGFHSPEAVQLMIEVERRAYADRSEFMGDADFYTAPVQAITSQAYLDQRMQDFIPGKAGKSTEVLPGKIKVSEETTHLSVIDREGNAVAVTTTLNNGYGSITVVGRAGFLLNNEMDDFSIKPGVPNIYGAIGGQANAIVPGKRMLSSMTPTIVLKNNKPFLIVGTPGGTTIPTSVFQTLLNIIDFDLSTEEAVNKPKFHHQWLPDRVDIERDFPSTLAKALEKMGYQMHPRSAIGRTEVIRVLPNGQFEAVADKRGDDSAEGF
ncbi:MAG: gamma-glutamyltransferase [Flavisolibacter sp.]|jgi:gamma-glutamyltranspeptidase/glutathione hydrolase|nr:gamma-glutamyltransferase [Flavisolibacter sp.]